MASTTPLRVREPGEIAALVPHLTGFVPTESLVVVSLRGPRKRVGLTSRLDLDDAADRVDHLVRAVRRDGGRSSLLVVLTSAPSASQHPYAGLVAELERALQRAGADVEEALLVREGRWWNYRCERSCCPPEGRPVKAEGPVVLAVAAEHVLQGQAVLPDRDHLVRSIAPDLPFGPAVALRLQAQAAARLQARLDVDRSGTVQAEVQAWARALEAYEQRPGPLDGAPAARLAMSLDVVPVRDALLRQASRRSAELLGLLQQVCRATAPPDDAAVCAALAWVAYARGNGALALVALQRALDSDPGLALARLLLQALDQLVPPTALLDVLRRAAS